ncbi:MAG: alanine racemase, partial [Bdellovibrionales bacterium]|nr:alanine racemase [Bdellovibrionales bacterium]
KANFLTPVMTLKSSVSDIKFVSKGQGVSYSHTWIAKHDSIIGIVPIGYADGVHRLLSNRGSVIVNNQRAPIIGNICMDYLMIDLTAIDRMTKVNKNCEVILLGFAKSGGEFIGADEQAVHAQTITWEVLTNVGVRVPRVVV